MKLTSFFTLFVCLVAVCSAAPIPGGPGEDGKGSKDKGKGRATTPPPSRPHTPTPAEDPNVPLPGRNGVHTHNGVTTAYYGDDRLPEHMGHLQRNQAAHPSNRHPMPLASDAEHDANRAHALAGVPSGGKYRNTKEDAYRDEKHLAMLSNKHHASTTTVEKLPAGESNIEGGLTSHMKSEMQAHGSKGQIRANPGWKTLDPKQRIAHEAPARLNSQSHRKVDPNAPSKKMTKSKVDPAVAEAEAKKKAEGYTPVVGTSGMNLRHRVGVAPPPAPIKKEPKASGSGSNLSPGRVSAPGHLWHPNQHGASHAGAPRPVTNSASRQPPRPQDHDHHMRQQHEAHATAQAALQRPHANPHPGPASTNPAHNSAHFRNNLANFNAAHPPHAPAHGAHHAEAPARLQHPPAHNAAHAAGTHPPAHATGSHPPAHATGSHPPAHQAALPHHPAPPAKSGAKKSGKK